MRQRQPKAQPAQPPLPAQPLPDWEYGWVVRAAKVRTGGADPQWMVDYDRAKDGFGKMVGLTSDLQEAEFFTEREKAEGTAHWQLGHVKRAQRDKRAGTIREL